MSQPTKSDKNDELHEDQMKAELGKRPYTKPVLLAHGNLREITLAVAHVSPKTDGGTYPNSRTA